MRMSASGCCSPAQLRSGTQQRSCRASQGGSGRSRLRCPAACGTCVRNTTTSRIGWLFSMSTLHLAASTCWKLSLYFGGRPGTRYPKACCAVAAVHAVSRQQPWHGRRRAAATAGERQRRARRGRACFGGVCMSTERAQAVWMRQQQRIQTGPLLHPRVHRPAPTHPRPAPRPRRCRLRPTGAAPGPVGVVRHRPPVARARAGKTHDTGSAPGLPQASVAAAAPRGPCTLTRLLAPRTLPYVQIHEVWSVDLYCDILTILFYTPAHSRCS